MFEVAFFTAGAIVVLGFVVVFGAIAYRGFKSASDPDYRARLQAQARTRRRRNSGFDSVNDPGDPANPNNPGNPASPMFPGNPGNPL